MDAHILLDNLLLALHMVPKASFGEEAFSTNLAEIRPVPVIIRHVSITLGLRGEFLLTLLTLDHRSTALSFVHVDETLCSVGAKVFHQHVFVSRELLTQ